jgi:hypothetical protein
MSIASRLLVISVACSPFTSHAAVKTESFNHDPNWDGHNNRVEMKAPKTVAQDFGYRDSNFAGAAKGEIGGTIWRSSSRASYADAIEPKTLNDRLSASGTFALTNSSGSSGIFFGWFKNDSAEGGRQSTLGIHLAGEGSGGRITLQLVTASNQACGTKVTPWVVDKTKTRAEGRKYRPTEVRNDGTRYTWTLGYDPAANNGDGELSFVIKSNRDTHDAWEGKTFTVQLPKGYKQQTTTFDRFGLLSSGRPGNSMTIYFDDMEHDGKKFDFAADPGWSGSGNQVKYEQRSGGGVHDFGFSEKTNFAGSSPGELGGTMWRSGEYAYYADRTEALSMDTPLEASGKIILEVGPPDSGMFFGWFNSDEKEYSPLQAGQFIGVKVGGPTRVGHYFTPAYATKQTSRPAQGDKQHAKTIDVERGQGPVLTPQKVFDWKLIYDPTANGGTGAVTATLGDNSTTLNLKPGDKAKGATFDHFGLFTTHRGGSYVRIYFDDLKYTASAK